MVGKLGLQDFTKEARGILGQAAPVKGSLEELRAAWRLMRAAVAAVAIPLYMMSEFDEGLVTLAPSLPRWSRALVEMYARYTDEPRILSSLVGR